MSVKLIIKSAAQSVEDFALDCEFTWTICEVKNQISVLYPTKPTKEQQKLIYGGKLLPDHLTLKSVLNQTQDVYTLHLVCPLPPVSNTEKLNTKKEKSVPPVHTTPPPQIPNEAYPQMTTEQMFSPELTSGMPAEINALGYNSVPGSPQQYLAMQQMYTQMMAQYMAQFNGGFPYMPVVANASSVQASPPPTLPPPRNPPPRQNDEEERDYIDYLYVFSRVAMLTAILLYYSSMARVITVLVMVLLIAMFAKINKQRQQEELHRRANERQTTEGNAPEPASSDVPISEAEEVTDDSSQETQIQEPQSAPSPAPSVPTTVITLVTAFFSSLIPSEPLPVNVN